MVKTDFCQGEEVVDRIVAIVNDEIITLSELNAVYKPVLTEARARGYSLKKQRKILFKSRDDILEDLIDNMLVDQEVKRLNLSVRDSEIEGAIKAEKESLALTDDEFNTRLKQQGLTLGKYRKRIRLQMLREKMIDFQIISRVVVTPEEVAAYYKQHREKFAGRREYHLGGIIKKLPRGSNLEEKNGVYQEMEKILKLLQRGVPFLTVLKTYSKPPFAAKGGDLGGFTLEQLSLKIRQAIHGLREGEHTPVIETDQGFQILMVQKIAQSEGTSLEAATPEIERILKRPLFDKQFQTWLGGLRRRSHVQIVTPQFNKQTD